MSLVRTWFGQIHPRWTIDCDIVIQIALFASDPPTTALHFFFCHYHRQRSSSSRFLWRPPWSPPRSLAHTPPPLRSTVTGPLLSRVSSAVFIRMARRLSDTCPFFTAHISCRGKQEKREISSLVIYRRSLNVSHSEKEKSFSFQQINSEDLLIFNPPVWVVQLEPVYSNSGKGQTCQTSRSPQTEIIERAALVPHVETSPHLHIPHQHQPSSSGVKAAEPGLVFYIVSNDQCVGKCFPLTGICIHFQPGAALTPPPTF